MYTSCSECLRSVHAWFNVYYISYDNDDVHLVWSNIYAYKCSCIYCIYTTPWLQVVLQMICILSNSLSLTHTHTHTHKHTNTNLQTHNIQTYSAYTHTHTHTRAHIISGKHCEYISLKCAHMCATPLQLVTYYYWFMTKNCTRPSYRC